MELKIGDTVFGNSTYHGFSKLIVKRETNTQIILENQYQKEIKVRKPFKNGCTEIGSSGYGNTSYYFSDEKIKEMYKRQINNKEISCFPFSKLSNEKIEQLVDFLRTLKETV